MEEDDGLIGALAQAVLDGDPIDWAAAESAGDEASRLIRGLRLVDAMARGQRESFIELDLPENSPAVPGPRWGHLRLVECIGRGAFGEVYRAWDTRLERDVALKLLPAEGASGGDAREMLREARLLARVRHSNVVTIHGADLSGAHAGLWMELVRGHTLEALLEAGEKFPPAEVARIGLDVAGALHAVHEAGLLHRDVKAQNVMRDDDGRIVLMDFGTGLRVGERQGALAGTPLYMAPEIFRGQPATARSDVYSLGVLLFHLLTGSFPVQSTTIEELGRAHEQEHPQGRHALGPDVPPALARVVSRAIEPRPEARYPSIAAMAADLEAASVPPRRRWPWVAGPAVAMAALASLVWLGPERTVLGVLPFEVGGSNAGDNVLAKGLVIDLNRRLAQVEGLKVRFAVSAPPSAKAPRDLQTLGRELGANHVLLGRVSGVAGTIRRVEASLVSVADRQTIWKASFDPANDNLFAVKERIAIDVARTLGLRFARGRKSHATEPGLQKLFLQAQAFRARRDAESSRSAVTLLEAINREDPAFIPAAAALARALLTVAADRDVEPRLDPRAEALSISAHHVDPVWPDANAARGLLCAFKHDWTCARRFFEEAIRLDPGLTDTRVDFVLSTLLPLGEVAEALRLIEDACVEDPMSLDVKRALAHLQVENGLYDQAIQTSKEITALDADLRFVEQWIGRALYLSGRSPEALEFFAHERRREPMWVYRAYVLATLGRHDEAKALLAQHPRVDARHMFVYAALGDRERAFDALRQAAALDPWRTVTWMQRAEVAPLRADPRYAEMKTRLLQRR